MTERNFIMSENKELNELAFKLASASAYGSLCQKIANELSEVKREDIKAVQSVILSTEDDPRYIVTDKNTGAILDTNNGYGYTTAEKAYKAFMYKHRDTSKDVQKEAVKEKVLDWLDNHTEFEQLMIYEYLMIVPKSKETGVKFNTAYLRKRLKGEGITVEDFKVSDLLKIFISKNFDN